MTKYKNYKPNQYLETPDNIKWMKENLPPDTKSEWIRSLTEKAIKSKKK